jgi:hypothetical protein
VLLREEEDMRAITLLFVLLLLTGLSLWGGGCLNDLLREIRSAQRPELDAEVEVNRVFTRQVHELFARHGNKKTVEFQREYQVLQQIRDAKVAAIRGK